MKYLVLILSVLFVVSVGAFAHASCDVVWHPGDVMYVDAGHEVKVIVDQDDLQAYAKNKVPDKYLPLPSDDNLNKMLEQGQHTHYCGDYRELTDDDVYGAVQ